MGIRWGRGFFRLWMALSLLWAGIIIFTTNNEVDWTQSFSPTSEERWCRNLAKETKYRPITELSDKELDGEIAALQSGSKGQLMCTTAASLAQRERKAMWDGLILLVVPPLGALASGLILAWILKGFRPQRTSA